MKKAIAYIILLSLIIYGNSVIAQQVIVTDDASYTTPASGAALDVKSISKGFMPPRVALASITDVTTIASPATGLMVYNNGTGGLTDKGIYFWNGTIWSKPLTGGTTGTNTMAIADDGTVSLKGSATAWNDLVVNPYVARNSGVSVPDWTLFVQPNVFTWEFKNVSTKDVSFTVQLPHDYKEGSTIHPHIHWSATAAPGTNRVTWKLDYQWQNHQTSFSPTAVSTTSNYVVAGVTGRSIAAYEHTITSLSSSGLDGTGKTISSILVCRLSRDGDDANDTFTGSAFLLSIDFHYEIDSFGSSLEYVK